MDLDPEHFESLHGNKPGAGAWDLSELASLTRRLGSALAQAESIVDQIENKAGDQ